MWNISRECIPRAGRTSRSIFRTSFFCTFSSILVASVDEEGLLCNPSSSDFSAADNLLISVVAIVLVFSKAGCSGNHWVNTVPDSYSAPMFYSPMISRRGQLSL